MERVTARNGSVPILRWWVHGDTGMLPFSSSLDLQLRVALCRHILSSLDVEEQIRKNWKNESCTDTSSHTSNLSIGKGIGVEGFGRGMEQGEEVKKKGGVPLDFEKLFASQDDDDDDVEPPLPEVATTIVDDDVEQKQREELQKMRDRELEEAIAKFGRTLKAVGLNLPDGGVKMRANIKRYQDELDRRRLRRLEKLTSTVCCCSASFAMSETERNNDRKDDDGCEKLTESNGPNFTSESDGVRQEASLPSSQSLFTARFSKKLDGKNQTNSRTVNAFESELSVLGRCDRGKIQYKGKPMTTLSSRQSPFQCPTNLSVDGDKHVRLNYRQNGGHFSTGSPRISEGKVSGFVSKKYGYFLFFPSLFFSSFFLRRKPSQVMSSNNVRPRNVSDGRMDCSDKVVVVKEKRVENRMKKRNKEQEEINRVWLFSWILSNLGRCISQGKTVVLVDEEEPELSDSMELADEPDECIMKDSKIYYPSSDDPESIEICYSDMECLNPQAYLSSTIMNFYIRYLQRNSPTRARRDYHFFNTYFYNKLKEAVLKKNDQASYFIKFRRWWKGVNIFHKAYILLPIHETVHWSLVIICIPDKEDESGPILLHLDSLGLHSSNLIFEKIRRLIDSSNNFLTASFLKEEWNYLNREEAPSDLPIADRIWKNLPRRIEGKKISVPQQKNDYDCGLFVLYFMERFIDVAPRRLKKKDLAMFSNEWFKPEEASSLRKKVRKLLLDEFRNATRQNCVSDQDPLSSVGPQEERLETIDC
ncbi:hypothetical protein RHMOL_Rhmol12G0141300 [Rhododendron molle]|uniref:Uncharacterized protein n=1 Tax=Rhododendron molle TaxID=49168 RepID=A0ACC0LI78_RHOML|nr:hypothetical protein RHMOL_Rhmol12G0141300 [Rhododendron molle]